MGMKNNPTKYSGSCAKGKPAATVGGSDKKSYPTFAKGGGKKK